MRHQRRWHNSRVHELTMASAHGIIAIRDRYAQDGAFPFLDWATNPHSFVCLINFWDEVFRLAAGEKYTAFTAVQDVDLDPNSPLYFVQNADATKKIRIWHGLTETGETDIAFYWGRYPDLNRPDAVGSGYSHTIEGVYMLEIASDFDPGGLSAVAVMLNEFIHADTSTDAVHAALEDSFETRFRPYFPIPQIDMSDDESDEEDD